MAISCANAERLFFKTIITDALCHEIATTRVWTFPLFYQIFHAAETKLKRIAIIQHEPDVDATAASSQRRGAYESLPQHPVAAPPMSAQERAVRLNVMRAVGARVQDSTRQFRAMQKEFLSRLKGQEQTGNEFFASDREEPITLDELDMVCDRRSAKCRIVESQAASF